MNLAILAFELLTSRTIRKEICCKPLNLWQFVTVAIRNKYSLDSRAILPSPGTLGNDWRHLWLSQDSPHNKELSSQTVNSPEVEKPCSRMTLVGFQGDFPYPPSLLFSFKNTSQCIPERDREISLLTDKSCDPQLNPGRQANIHSAKAHKNITAVHCALFIQSCYDSKVIVFKTKNIHFRIQSTIL